MSRLRKTTPQFIEEAQRVLLKMEHTKRRRNAKRQPQRRAGWKVFLTLLTIIGKVQITMHFPDCLFIF